MTLRPLFRFPLLVVLGCALVGAGVGAQDIAGERIEISSSKSILETAQHLEWRFGQFGMAIAWATDYRSSLGGGERIPQALVFEVMRAKWAETILLHEPDLILLLPVRVAVQPDRNGGVTISYFDLTKFVSAGSDENVVVLAGEITTKVRQAIELAAR